MSFESDFYRLISSTHHREFCIYLMHKYAKNFNYEMERKFVAYFITYPKFYFNARYAF
jgi:hypothetical protein